MAQLATGRLDYCNDRSSRRPSTIHALSTSARSECGRTYSHRPLIVWPQQTAAVRLTGHWLPVVCRVQTMLSDARDC